MGGLYYHVSSMDWTTRLDLDSVILISILLALVCLCLSQYAYERKSSQMKMPIIPTPLPYLGQALLFLQRRPWDVLMEWHTERGGIFGFQLLGAIAVSLADPELIKMVLQSKIASVKKDVANTYYHFLVILGKGIVTSESKEWMKQRLKMSTALRQDVLEWIPPVTLRAVQRFMTALDEASETGQPIQLSTALRHLTLQVISGTFLSISAEESDSTFGQMYLPIVDESNTRVWHGYRAYLFFLPSWWTYHYNVYKLNSYVSTLIRNRWRERRQGKTYGDMLDHVLKAYEQEVGLEQCKDHPMPTEAVHQIRDEMKTFMLAGHETSAAMMTWALYELMDDPVLRNQVTEEGNKVFTPTTNWKDAAVEQLPSPENIAQLTLTEACLKVRHTTEVSSFEYAYMAFFCFVFLFFLIGVRMGISPNFSLYRRRRRL